MDPVRPGKKLPIHLKSAQTRLHIKGGKIVNDDMILDGDVYIEDGIIRTMLAVLHFNENGNRAHAVTREGVERFRVKHPKANGGEPVAVPEKEGPTYGYIARLLEAVQEGVQSKALRACVAMTADDPPPLINSARKVSKVELVQKHKTRFNR